MRAKARLLKRRSLKELACILKSDSSLQFLHKGKNCAYGILRIWGRGWALEACNKVLPAVGFTIEISSNGFIRMFDDSQIQEGDLHIVKTKGETQVELVDI